MTKNNIAIFDLGSLPIYSKVPTKPPTWTLSVAV